MTHWLTQKQRARFAHQCFVLAQNLVTLASVTTYDLQDEKIIEIIERNYVFALDQYIYTATDPYHFLAVRNEKLLTALQDFLGITRRQINCFYTSIQNASELVSQDEKRTKPQPLIEKEQKQFNNEFQNLCPGLLDFE